MSFGSLGRFLIVAVICAAPAAAQVASPEGCPPDPRGIVPGCPSVQPVRIEPVDQAEGADQGAQMGQSEAREQASDPALLAVEEAVRALIREITPSEEDETVAADEEQRAKDDLKAQQDMAKWAFGLLWVSVGQLLLTGWGLFFIWLQLKAMRATLKDAAEGTKAAIATANTAIEANTLNRQAFVAERRAWIEIADIRMASPLTWTKTANNQLDRGQTSVEFVLKNIGNSPAFDAFAIADIKPYDINSDLGLLKYERFALEHRNTTELPDWNETIFPNGQLFQRRSLGFDREFSVFERQFCLLLLICVTYETILDRERRQTGLAIPIAAPDASGTWRRIAPEPGEIPAGELQLKRGFNKNIFAD